MIGEISLSNVTQRSENVNNVPGMKWFESERTIRVHDLARVSANRMHQIAGVR